MEDEREKSAKLPRGLIHDEKSATELWPVMSVGEYVVCAVIGFLIAMAVYYWNYWR